MRVSLVRRPTGRNDRADPARSEEVQREIERVVREQLLLGSERALPIDVPLGELGLDSLALLHLIMAIEETFGVQLPDDLLVRHDPMSIQDFVDMVIAMPQTRPATLAAPPADPTSLPPHFRMERLHRWLARRGWFGRRMQAVATLAWHAKRFLFDRSEQYVLERRLGDGQEPRIQVPSGVDLRPYARADQEMMAGLWPAYDARRSRRQLRRWLVNEGIALVAVEGGRVVALDVLSAHGHPGEVELSAARGGCWGLHLVEAPDARGRGIGLALLAYSLRVARARGFRAQLATVMSNNAPMIAASTQLLGFQVIGMAHRTRIFGVTRWLWEIEGVRRRGRVLTI
jgi:acyl carrier protein